MEFKKMFFWWLTFTLSIMIALFLFKSIFLTIDFEKIFKTDKSIIVIGTSNLNDSEKTELIEKAKVNGYELKMLGNDDYIFEKIKK